VGGAIRSSARTLGEPRLLLALGFFACITLLTLSLIRIQPAGIDFLAMWAGGKASAMGAAYDMQVVTNLQGWPLGPDYPRPFPYPPTALLVFAPLSALPWQSAYVVWLALSLPLFAYAGHRAGAPLWFVLVPWVAFAAYCGQATLLLGAFVILGLLERRTRPALAGVLFGVAAALKPQFLILVPLALAIERRWFVIGVAGVTGLTICGLATLLWGVTTWLDWLNSLAGFAAEIVDKPRLIANGITPTSALRHLGLDQRWALLCTAPAVAMVWWAFRRETTFESQLVALMGGTFLISPYALHYELAVFAPAVGIYLARTNHPRWIASLAACVAHVLLMHPAVLNMLAALILPLLGGRPAKATQ
jgi:hypothetical protein